MLAAARHRTEGLANLTFLEGDVTALPVDDDAFDAALCVQVLEYVPDTAAALAELRRALVPGGRLVVWDVDWCTTSLSTRDDARTRRVLDAWDGHLAHPTLPRILPSRLRDAGFEDVRLDAHAFATDRFAPETYLGTIVALVESYVGGLGDDAADDVRGWVADLRDLDEQGAFYAAVTQVRVAARRPAA
jgi:SAM-dependent methyltransferase